MAHFAPPASGMNIDADYIVDNKMAPGSIGRMVVPPNGSADIVLCCGETLAVRSNNPNVIANPIPERRGDGGRILTIKPIATTGGAYIDFGFLNSDGWSWQPGSPWPGHLLINVENRAVAPVPDGLVRLAGPSMALNAADTPVPYDLTFNQPVPSATSAEAVIALAKSKGKLKHLVFSCHGEIVYKVIDGEDPDGKVKKSEITDSIIRIGKGLNREESVKLFPQLKSMSGGVIWAASCAIGDDIEANKLRASNSSCYFVAPIMYMQMGKGWKKPGKNMIDMYKRFQPKVFTPGGALMNWDVFVRTYGERLGITVVAP
jgi:hypothetical protein